MTSRSEITVRRWTYPRDRGGTDGMVPLKAQFDLLRAARNEGVNLTPEDFIPAQMRGSQMGGRSGKKTPPIGNKLFPERGCV